jgi:hypothetical protein
VPIIHVPPPTLTNPDQPLPLILVILGAAVVLAVLPVVSKKEATTVDDQTNGLPSQEKLRVGDK